MLIGLREKFAVEVNVTLVIDGWVYGNYMLWIDGLRVGDELDDTVDLKGCWHWMKDFIAKPMDRYEAGLYDMDKRQVYLRLASPILDSGNPHAFAKEIYCSTYDRFHITHIGMSSFDKVTLLLVKDLEGRERLIWGAGGGDVRDSFLAPNYMEKIFGEAIRELEETMVSAGEKR